MVLDSDPDPEPSQNAVYCSLSRVLSFQKNLDFGSGMRSNECPFSYLRHRSCGGKVIHLSACLYVCLSVCYQNILKSY